MKCSITFGSIISKACVLFCSSAVKVHDSQTYRDIEMTTERNSFACDQKEMLLSFQIDFSFVRSTVAWTVLERTSWVRWGSALVLGKLPVPGRPTIWIAVWQGPTALVVGAGGASLLFLPLFGRRPDID